jgi:hypothetical protein
MTFHVETRCAEWAAAAFSDETLENWSEHWDSRARQPITDIKESLRVASWVFEAGAGNMDVRVVTSKGEIIIEEKGE